MRRRAAAAANAAATAVVVFDATAAGCCATGRTIYLVVMITVIRLVVGLEQTHALAMCTMRRRNLRCIKGTSY